MFERLGQFEGQATGGSGSVARVGVAGVSSLASDVVEADQPLVEIVVHPALRRAI
jgi:hypothetical protein